jgi:hypothetical protein
MRDEIHDGAVYLWKFADYNGDGIANWVPITTFGSGIKITELMKQLRLPQWLTKNTTFYVSSTGVNSAKRTGLSPDQAFATIQYAVNYIAENYNMATYTATVLVSAGTYRVGRIELPKYQSVTGTIAIKGEDKDTVIIEGIFRHATGGAGSYTISDMTIRFYNNNTSGGSTWGAISAGAGNAVTCRNIQFIVPQFEGLYYRKCFAVSGGAIGYWEEGNTVDGYVTCVWDVLNATLHVRFDTTITVTIRPGITPRAVALFSNNGLLNFSRPNNNYPEPVIYGTAEGKRYLGDTGAICRTPTGSEDYIPGTIAGTLDSTAIYR